MRPTPTYLALSDLGQAPIPVEVKKDDGRPPNWIFYVSMVGAVASIVSLAFLLGKKK